MNGLSRIGAGGLEIAGISMCVILFVPWRKYADLAAAADRE